MKYNSYRQAVNRYAKQEEKRDEYYIIYRVILMSQKRCNTWDG